MDEKEARHALKKVKQALDKKNIEYWLDAGTLLGAVRENRFIPWDHDIDLGAWLKSYPSLCEACKELSEDFDYRSIDGSFPKGERWQKIFLEKINPIIRIDYKNFNYEDFHIDILLYNETENRAEKLTKQYPSFTKHFGLRSEIKHIRWQIKNTSIKWRNKEGLQSLLDRFLTIFPDKMKSEMLKILLLFYDKLVYHEAKIKIPKNFFNDLEEIQFYDMKFKTPSPVEEYLEYRYGENWRQPQKDYTSYNPEDNQSLIRESK